MEPIVSPWFFYFINVCENMGIAATVCWVVCGIIFIVALIGFALCKYDSTFDADFIPAWKRARKYSLICTLVFMVFAIFAPSRKTLIWMVVADNVTQKNIEKAIDAGKDIKDELKKDIIEIVESIMNGDNKNQP